MIKKLIFAVLCLFSLVGASDVLLWTVDESTTVDGTLIQSFLQSYPTTEDNWPAARVKMISSDGTSSRVLDIYWGDGIQEDGNWGVALSDPGSGYWGAGAQVGMQSETGYHTLGTIQGELHGDILSYPPEVMEILFIMELGYNSWNDDVGDYVWETLAQSAPELYETLQHQYMYAEFDIAPSDGHAWKPNFSTTPEPSSLLLTLFGTGLLLLRRKQL